MFLHYWSANQNILISYASIKFNYFTVAPESTVLYCEYICCSNFADPHDVCRPRKIYLSRSCTICINYNISQNIFVWYAFVVFMCIMFASKSGERKEFQNYQYQMPTNSIYLLPTHIRIYPCITCTMESKIVFVRLQTRVTTSFVRGKYHKTDIDILVIFSPFLLCAYYLRRTAKVMFHLCWFVC